MGQINNLFSLICYFPKFQPNMRIFNSRKNSTGSWLIYLYGINNYLLHVYKNSYGAGFASLIDIVGMDLSKLTNYACVFNSQYITGLPVTFNRLVNYNVMDYKNNSRLIFSVFLNKTDIVNSLESVFYNSNWLERELVEFLNINVYSRSDTRNLLLDYNFSGNPLLKNYPTEGHQEIFFNHLTYNLEYLNAEFVEL